MESSGTRRRSEPLRILLSHDPAPEETALSWSRARTVLRALWSQLARHRKAVAAARGAEMQRRTPAERRFVDERFEDRQADTAAEEQLGGIDPARLLDSEDSPRGQAEDVR